MLNVFFTYGLPIAMACIAAITLYYVVLERGARQFNQAFDSASALLAEIDDELTTDRKECQGWRDIDVNKFINKIRRLGGQTEKLFYFLRKIKDEDLINDPRLNKDKVADKLILLIHSLCHSKQASLNTITEQLSPKDKQNFFSLFKLVYSHNLTEASDEKACLNKTTDEVIEEMSPGANYNNGYEQFLRSIIELCQR